MNSAPTKAIAAAVTTIAGVAVQWATTGHLSLDQEGVTGLVGAVATVVVYFVSNTRRTS